MKAWKTPQNLKTGKRRTPSREPNLSKWYDAIVNEASAKNLPYLDFLKQTLEAESQTKVSVT